MQYKQNTPVLTPSGTHVGHIDRVVINPKTREVEYLVVRKGVLFVEDKVVPINLVHTATEERVTLKEEAGKLVSLPEFNEVEYLPFERIKPGTENVNAQGRVNLGGVGYATPYFWYPSVGAQPWASPMSAGPGYEARVKENIPENDVALKKGTRVMTSDNKEAGSIEEVITQGNDKKVTHFVMTHGLINKTHKAIPVIWIKNMRENEITLDVTEEMLEMLPEHHK